MKLITVTNYKKFHILFTQYQNELMSILNEKWNVYSPKQIEKISKSHPGFKDKFIVEDGLIVGLICYQNLNGLIYINQLYILPEYRRNRIAYNTVKELLDTFNQDKLVFEVLNKNKTAKKFWKKTLKECKMKKIDKKPIEDFVRYVYGRK